MPQLSSPRRILVIPLRYIGDTILTVPLIRNLKHHYPQAEIDVLCSASAAPLLAPCPYIHQVIIEPKGTSARFNLLRKGHYEQVFSLRKSASMALLCKLAGIPQVIGYDKQRFPFGYKRWGLYLDHQARYPGLKTDVPQPLSHLSLLHTLDLPVMDSHLELWATDADQQAVTALLTEHGIAADKPLAVFHAASASHGKQLELEKFIESLQHLNAAGYRIITTGTTSDQPVYDLLAQQTGLPLLNLAGKTSLRETFALYQRIQLLLTVDSSPIHLGAAAGVPKLVGVFGPTNEKQWGPHALHTQFAPVFLDLPCRPCYAKVCSHNNCKVLLPPSQITTALDRLISPQP